jgi:Domain of unknown function (DUF3846)
MTDTEALALRHAVRPESFWAAERRRGVGGYEVMSTAAQHGWHAVASWGEDGWNLGSWPLVVLFIRNRAGWEVAHYVEGDVTAYSFPHQATRDTVIDSHAFWYWKNADEPWVSAYERVEQLPARLRGPYGAERTGTPTLVRLVFIPVHGAAEVWYVRSELSTLQSIVDGPLQAVPLARDAHAYCDEEAKLMRKVVNHTATALWHALIPEAVGHDVLNGDVLILGQHGAEEADCPQWVIDALAVEFADHTEE